jgi:hypothetical protein
MVPYESDTECSQYLKKITAEFDHTPVAAPLRASDEWIPQLSTFEAAFCRIAGR